MSPGLNIFFGGSFDPPHLGHHSILRALLEDAWTQNVFLVPTFQNPLKKLESSGNTIFKKREHRLEWLDLWLKEIEKDCSFYHHSKLQVEMSEILSSSPSYTIDTLKKLISQESSKKLPWALAVGGDVLPELGRWKNIEELLTLLHSFWIFPRGKQKNPIGEIPSSLKSLCQYRVMNDPIREISSTEIRDDILKKMSGKSSPSRPSTLLPLIEQSLTRLVQAQS